MKAQDNIYDSSDTRELLNPTFTEASTRANINSKESHSIILGKIKKWFADLDADFFDMVGQPEDVTDPSNPIPGIATLDENGHVPTTQLPSYVDDVLEGYLNKDGKFYQEKVVNGYTPATPAGSENPREEWWYEYDGSGYIRTTDTVVVSGKTYYIENATYSKPYTPETGKVYVDFPTNVTYRWGGSSYILIGTDLALGETSGTAYRGDRGKAAYDHSQITSGNPHNSNASDVGAVAITANQNLTDTQKANARANIGVGTITEFINAIYPIGAIYLSVTNTNPGTFFTGTTWELLPDGYLRNNASDASGGSLTSGSTTLTIDQIPSHSHTATTQSTGAHTHTATTQSTGAHTHTTNSKGSHSHTATTGSYGNHTHTLTTQNTGAHTHTATTGSYGNHTHTATTESKGNHQHSHTLTMDAHSHAGYTGAASSSSPGSCFAIMQEDGNLVIYKWNGSSQSVLWSSGTGGQSGTYAGYYGAQIGKYQSNSVENATSTGSITDNSTGAHTHTLTTQNTGAHTHTLTTGSYGNHTHTATTQNTGAHTHTLTTESTGAHTHTTSSDGSHSHTLTTESKGSHSHTLTTEAIGGGKGHTHSIEPTYARVYAFKRTA